MGVHCETSADECTDEEADLSASMVQVGGTQGPMLVFRPWTMADMKEAIKQLPPATHGGKEFAICKIISTILSDSHAYLF